MRGVSARGRPARPVSVTSKRVPLPTSDDTDSWPLCRSTIIWQMLRPKPHAARLRGDERREEVRQSLGCDSVARVLDRDRDSALLRVWPVRMLQRPRPVGERRQRVDRVLHDVDEHLPQLPPVTDDARQTPPRARWSPRCRGRTARRRESSSDSRATSFTSTVLLRFLRILEQTAEAVDRLGDASAGTRHVVEIDLHVVRV